MTTELMKIVWREISRLPEDQQDSMATIILEELASERRWSEAFATHPQQLARLAEEALAEFRTGKTEPLDPHER